MPPNHKHSQNLVDDLIDAGPIVNLGEANLQQQVHSPLVAWKQDEDIVFFDIEENISSELAAEAAEDKLREEGQQQDDQKSASREDKTADQSHSSYHPVIRYLSSKLEDHEELNVDAKRLSRAVQDAGEYSRGVLACEVWLISAEDDHLFRPKGGCWYNAIICPDLMPHFDEEKKNTDPVLPGVGVPGILWAETELEHKEDHQDGLHLAHWAQHLHRPHHRAEEQPPHALFWRDIESLAEDPDSAKTERIHQFLAGGLQAAAGAPFRVGHQRGIVIYYGRHNCICEQPPSSSSDIANDAYLKAAAAMIGHAAALTEIRRASVESRRRHKKATTLKFQRNLMECCKSADKCKQRPRMEPISELCDCHMEQPDTTKEDASGFTDIVSHRFRACCHKCYGANLQIPPAVSVRQSLWTFFGAFCGLLLATSLNECYRFLSDGTYELLMGPFGALMTLQYGLPSSPASQPRNVLLGQAVAGAVSLAFTYIPEWILATWLRRALGPAVGIAAMAKLGVLHPPAGAHAVMYSTGDYGFAFYALVILSCSLSIIPATLVNNMSLKRQYPTYWALVNIPENWRNMFVGKGQNGKKTLK